MSLKEEKDLEYFESLMHMEEKGTKNDPGPYLVMKQPWKIDKDILEDKKSAILGVIYCTKTKFVRKRDWIYVYKRQLLDFLEKGFAREFSKAELEK